GGGVGGGGGEEGRAVREVGWKEGRVGCEFSAGVDRVVDGLFVDRHEQSTPRAQEQERGTRARGVDLGVAEGTDVGGAACVVPESTALAGAVLEVVEGDAAGPRP